MVSTLGFLDLHSHVLPNLDDGARNETMAMRMLRGLASIGFDTVFATPHQKDGQFMPTAEQITCAHQSLVTQLQEAQIPLQLGIAAENMWDSVFYERCTHQKIPTYNGGNAFLFELPLKLLPMHFRETLFRLRELGMLPVLAHPERYEPLWKDPDLVETLRGECAMVVDLGAVAGYHGRKRTKYARKMLKDNVVHAVASDAHTPGDIRIAAEGIRWIQKKLGSTTVDRLLDTNPRLITTGHHPEW